MKRWSARKLLMLVLVVFVIPLGAWLCTKSPKAYYLFSLLVLFLSLCVFYLRFERKKPQAREMVLIAVLCALATVSRILFQMVPFFKPLLGIAMIAGAAFGCETGFLVGSVSILASNFLFGQGTWTPWQMFAYGFGAWLFALIVRFRSPFDLPKNIRDSLLLGLLGFLITVIVTGPLLDTSTFFFMTSQNTESALAVYLSGLPVNLIHGLATFLTILLGGKPLLEKLQRIRIKYGLEEEVDRAI